MAEFHGGGAILTATLAVVAYFGPVRSSAKADDTDRCNAIVTELSMRRRGFGDYLVPACHQIEKSVPNRGGRGG